MKSVATTPSMPLMRFVLLHHSVRFLPNLHDHFQPSLCICTCLIVGVLAYSGNSWNFASLLWCHGTFVLSAASLPQVWHLSYPSTQWTFHQELVPYDYPLVALHTTSIIFLYLWCMLDCSIWMWMKSSLFWFTEGQSHLASFSMQKWIWPSMNRY